VAAETRAFARRLGGGARRRIPVDCDCCSYSTDVLRCTVLVVREPEAHESFGVICGMSGMVETAWWNAVAILTEVSLTLHFSGCGGEEIIFGPPGRA
jgi:hypothetical protein